MTTKLGKRYECAECGTVVLCIKAGTADLECCGRRMHEKEMEQLPSGD
jgi:desulfoferrodoxin-like iron-binding protein